VAKVINLNHDFWPIGSRCFICDNEQMKNLLQLNNLSLVAAVSTWLAIYLISLNILLTSDSDFTQNIALISLGFVVYLVCFLILALERFHKSSQMTFALLAVQFASALFCMWLFPFNFLAILTIIWLGTLSHYTNLKTSLVMLVIAMGGFYLIYTYKWQQSFALTSTILYGTFHLFAILMSFQTKQAEVAKEKLELLNAKLEASQQLVSKAAKQQERTRIARNLHDLLGHHLTALSINLQVASRITEGEAQAKVDTCHSIAKLLLSDVRDAVSSLRDQQEFDLRAMIDSLKKHLPNINITSEIDSSINIDDITILDSLMFVIQEALTNSIKHAKASEFHIKLTQDQQQLILELTNDGETIDSISYGNGLTGMHERIHHLGGSMQIVSEPTFNINIRLPAPSHSSSQPALTH
jgi:two-component system, NarL family, sensor histidine kinase DesK